MKTYDFHPFVSEMDMLRIQQALDAHIGLMQSQLAAEPEREWLQDRINDALRIKQELKHGPTNVLYYDLDGNPMETPNEGCTAT